MNEAEAVFKQDSKGRRSGGFGSHTTGSIKGGAVRFPSDTLKPKEIKALSGEVSSYNLRKPMSWKAFKEMPIDLQREYAEWLERTFLFTAAEATRLFGLYYTSWSRYRTGVLGMKPIKGSRRRPTPAEAASFERWLSGGQSYQDDEKEVEEVDTIEKSEGENVAETECLPCQQTEQKAQTMVVRGGDITVTASVSELAQILAVLVGVERRTFRVSFGAE